MFTNTKRGVISVYKMFKSKIRVRKHSYELIVEMIYRIEMNLLGKRKEFGRITSQLAGPLSNLLVAARHAKTQIELHCHSEKEFTPRSRELNSVISAIDVLFEADVLLHQRLGRSDEK